MINFSNFFITPPKTFQFILGVAGQRNTDFVSFVTILPIFAAKRPDYLWVCQNQMKLIRIDVTNRRCSNFTLCDKMVIIRAWTLTVGPYGKYVTFTYLSFLLHTFSPEGLKAIVDFTSTKITPRANHLVNTGRILSIRLRSMLTFLTRS